jgi:outer membrane protein TolC
VELRAATEAAKVRLAVVGSAKEALELARLRYGAGLTTNLDVVTAQGNLSEAEEEEIHARYDMLLARARLAQARGSVVSFLGANP